MADSHAGDHLRTAGPISRRGVVSHVGGAPHAVAERHFAGALAAERGGGRPLEPEIRTDFEPRLGHDLSGVRVHSGHRAAALSGEIGARAFTHGSDIFFGAGRFDPDSKPGRRLLAHELTHVVQQAGRPGLIQREPEGSAPRPSVRPATPEERREFARMAAHFLDGQGEFFAGRPDRPLDQVLGHMRTSAESGLRAISGLDNAQAEAQAVRNAYRQAVRRVLAAHSGVAPSPGREPPTIPTLFERHRNDILAFALPGHEADPGADELSAELSAAVPAGAGRDQRARHAAIASARQRMRVVGSSVAMELHPLFDVQGGRMRVGLPANTAVRFAANVPQGLQHGLGNAAAQLVGNPLVENTSVMLALDLSRYGGDNATWRFTRIDLGGTLGTEILVERQGTIGIEGLRDEERAGLRERFDRLGFRRERGFDTDEFDQVLIGLSQVPEAQLGTLRGLRFARAGVDPADPLTGGTYDLLTHTLTLFDPAFGGGLTRLGTGARPLTIAASSVVHEIGHALDQNALRTTAAATEAAQQALLAEFGTGGGGFRIPGRGAPDRARFNALRGALTTAERAETAARAHSGARWQAGALTDAQARGARQPAFRQAAIRDGANPPGRGFPTTYPNPDSFWQEYFAEAFMLFRTSPNLLQRLRPNVFAFMHQTFPQSAQGGAAGGNPGP